MARSSEIVDLDKGINAQNSVWIPLYVFVTGFADASLLVVRRFNDQLLNTEEMVGTDC